MNKYDPKYWKHGVNMTVGQFCEYVREKIPPDTVLYICGVNSVDVHYSPEGNVFSLDLDDLSDLPEYEGSEAGELITEALSIINESTIPATFRQEGNNI